MIKYLEIIKITLNNFINDELIVDSNKFIYTIIKINTLYILKLKFTFKNRVIKYFIPPYLGVKITSCIIVHGSHFKLNLSCFYD